MWSPELGWLDLDPTNDQFPPTRHVTVGWGRDYFDVAPVRGVVIGPSAEQTLSVAVDVRRLRRDPRRMPTGFGGRDTSRSRTRGRGFHGISCAPRPWARVPTNRSTGMVRFPLVPVRVRAQTGPVADRRLAA